MILDLQLESGYRMGICFVQQIQNYMVTHQDVKNSYWLRFEMLPNYAQAVGCYSSGLPVKGTSKSKTTQPTIQPNEPLGKC